MNEEKEEIERKGRENISLDGGGVNDRREAGLWKGGRIDEEVSRRV